MNDDTCGRTAEEIDEARHSRAKGTVVLRAIADELRQIAVAGKTISPQDLKGLHAQLFKVYQLLDRHIVWNMEHEPEQATYAEEAAVNAYCDTYSDGTPVSIVMGPPSGRRWSAPGNVYDCVIPWHPKMSHNGYITHGPIPPGCEVTVVDPPHWRKLKALQPAMTRTGTSKR